MPPVLAQAPFRAIVVIDAEVSAHWRAEVSKWLIDCGCLYMLAWGCDCSLWDDSLDIANLESFGFGEIPEDKFVMTTWHAEEELAQVFWFSRNCASHPAVELERTVIFHISDGERENEFIAMYQDA